MTAIWPYIVTGIFTLAGVFITYWQTRKGQQAGERIQGYDQIQEDLAATRAALAQMNKERAEDRAAAIAERERDRQNASADRDEITYLINLVSDMEDQLDFIYDGVRSGTIPPMPPRKPRPSRPLRHVS